MKTRTISAIPQIKGSLRITYQWHRSDGSPVRPKHYEALEETAHEQAFAMLRDGFTCGDLHDVIRMGDEDGEDGVEYSGWWESVTDSPGPVTSYRRQP